MAETDQGDAVPESITTPGLFMPDGRPTNACWRMFQKHFAKRFVDVKQRRGRGGTYNYVDARQVQERLDEVVGPGNWQTRFSERSDGSVECRLTIYGVTKTDVGYKNNPRAKPGDPEYEDEPLKAAYSDAFKRAAVQWGIGRHLYEG